jgi:CYTH domain-containing protein
MTDYPAPDGPLPVEIERKWLLDTLPEAARDVVPARLAQGYLPGEAIIERIRQVQRGSDTRWIRTIKLGRGVARIEVEEPVTDAFGEALWALTTGRRVTKQRYLIADGALTWEIDDFTDRALVLLEVELPSADHPVVFPGWLARHVVRDVTDDDAFTNRRLAR